MKSLTAIFLFTILISKSLAQDIDFNTSKVSIGGYGELHYNSEKVGSQPTKSSLDFHRFVLFLGYNWTEKWSLKTEIELEHNFVRNGQGEVELEQAYINYHYADWFGFNIGVILPSIGLINEYHEPPLFFGTERPVYHNLIIPTTWFGNGASVYSNINGFDIKLTIFESLNSDKFSFSQGIRPGRMKGYFPDASRFLYSARLDYLNIPGMKIGGSISFNNAKGDSTNVNLIISEFHSKYNANNITAVFEIGNISYDSGILRQSFGYYFDFGYDINSFFNLKTKIQPFIRYSDINTATKTSSGGLNEKLFHFKEIMFGISVKPIDEIVFKLDYSERTRQSDNRKSKFINFGAGFMF